MADYYNLPEIKHNNAQKVALIMQIRNSIHEESINYFDRVYEKENHTRLKAYKRIQPPSRKVKTEICIFKENCKHTSHFTCKYLHYNNENKYINPETGVIWIRKNKYDEWTQFYEYE